MVRIPHWGETDTLIFDVYQACCFTASLQIDNALTSTTWRVFYRPIEQSAMMRKRHSQVQVKKEIR